MVDWQTRLGRAVGGTGQATAIQEELASLAAAGGLERASTKARRRSRWSHAWIGRSQQARLEGTKAKSGRNCCCCYPRQSCNEFFTGHRKGGVAARSQLGLDRQLRTTMGGRPWEEDIVEHQLKWSRNRRTDISIPLLLHPRWICSQHGSNAL